MQEDLIYDVGMHKGEDTAFYLQKGFRVVAVEAVSEFCDRCRERFRTEVDSGRLEIVNKAISDTPGPVRFFMNERISVWGTISPDWAKRNEARGARSREVTVDATTIEDVVRRHGTPYYMKIDIEGADALCLKGLLGLSERPTFISVESSATSFTDTFEQLVLLRRLGYTKYKIVPQHRIEEQRCPNPPREGKYVDHRFEAGSSGLFGEELPYAWQSFARVGLRYAWIHFECRMMGPNNGVLRNLRNERVKELLKTVLFRNWDGWYDTHATFG